MKRKLKLMYLISDDRFFCSHFLGRAVAAREAGYDVVVMTHEHAHGEKIRSAGIRLAPMNPSRRGVKPLAAFLSLLKICFVYRRERADVLHHVGAKAIFLGSLAARLLPGKPAIVNAPTDVDQVHFDPVHLGQALSSDQPVARLLRPCVRLACRLLLNPRRSRVIFETADDAAWFIDSGTVRPADAAVIRGPGVDVRKLRPGAVQGGPPVVALAAPMRRDKGVHEFVAAARQLHEAGVSARFVLVGRPDHEHPASIPFQQLRSWHGVSGVEWWEWLTDMTLPWCDVHIACLPSWREGLPKALIEAAACGLPIVAADAPGCRDVVKNGDNGLLVPAGNVPSLAKALRILIADAGLRSRMGRQSRAVAEREFASEPVISETLAVYRSLVATGAGGASLQAGKAVSARAGTHSTGA
jgi:glycosyltransferase involved in cell wall biosynthesis